MPANAPAAPRPHTFGSFAYVLCCFVAVVGPSQAACRHWLEPRAAASEVAPPWHATFALAFVVSVQACLSIRAYATALDRSGAAGRVRQYAADLLYYVCLGPALATLNHYAAVRVAGVG